MATGKLDFVRDRCGGGLAAAGMAVLCADAGAAVAGGINPRWLECIIRQSAGRFPDQPVHRRASGYTLWPQP